MADYRVNLDIFAGPLDLLLYLVRKEEVDIYDISIAKITNQYIHYIEMLKSLDIDLAGDFLVMAATLMQIKSAMLLPKAEPDSALLGEDDLADPRTELIRQLLEYKKFKDAANLLNAAADEQKERFPRPATIVEQLKPTTEPEIDIEQVSIWNLLEAFDSICKATGTIGDISHIKDDTPIDLYQIEILHRLQTEGPMTFERIFESRTNRLTMIGLFLALLELIREELIWAKQQGSSSSVYLRPLTDEPAEQAVQKAIIAAEVDNKSAQPQASLEAATQQKPPPLTISEFASKIKSVVSHQMQEKVEDPSQQAEEIQPAEDHKN
ncbi:MAG: segregation/condensation protein A [Planctomycetes bacterium]|nr:segregation/condensation protein A [Planctomycetota bacterium]